jgi:hypothetical protein
MFQTSLRQPHTPSYTAPEGRRPRTYEERRMQAWIDHCTRIQEARKTLATAFTRPESRFSSVSRSGSVRTMPAPRTPRVPEGYLEALEEKYAYLKAENARLHEENVALHQENVHLKTPAPDPHAAFITALRGYAQCAVLQDIPEAPVFDRHGHIMDQGVFTQLYTTTRLNPVTRETLSLRLDQRLPSFMEKCVLEHLRAHPEGS